MAFLGMQGTGDWSETERPQNYRQGILRMYPNGMTPLTGMLSMMRSSKVDDPQYHWWGKRLPFQGGDVAGVFTDANLSSAYASGATLGTVVYVQAAQSVVEEFRPGHVARLGKSGDHRFNVNGKVIQRVTAGAGSFLALMLLQTPNPTYDLDEVDFVRNAGNMNPEGATMPDAIMYRPVKYTNLTQIHRTPLSITRTARLTRYRTGDALKEMKREALELHAIEQEKATIWGVLYEGIGENGEPERTSQGMISAIAEHAPGENTRDWLVDGESGDEWAEHGADWLDERLEVIFRYGDPEKMAVVGSGAMLAIQRLVRAGAIYNIDSSTVDYGLRVGRWITPFGDIYLKTHPLFSNDPAHRNDMLIIEPRRWGTRYITDTIYKPDNSETRNTNHSKDGTEEEFLTEIGLEWDLIDGNGYLSNLGQDVP